MKEHNIVFLHYIVFSMLSDLTLCSYSFFILELLIVLHLADLGTYKFCLEVTVYLAGCLWGRGALLYKPGAHLSWAGCIKLLQRQNIRAML